MTTSIGRGFLAVNKLPSVRDNKNFFANIKDFFFGCCSRSTETRASLFQNALENTGKTVFMPIPTKDMFELICLENQMRLNRNKELHPLVVNSGTEKRTLENLKSNLLVEYKEKLNKENLDLNVEKMNFSEDFVNNIMINFNEFIKNDKIGLMEQLDFIINNYSEDVALIDACKNMRSNVEKLQQIDPSEIKNMNINFNSPTNENLTKL